jgi:RNA polymerase sigma-70 factor (ECF subfamily)
MFQVTETTYEFEALCLPYEAVLFAFAMRLCGSNRAWAKDVLQDVWVRAWKAWPKWRPAEDGGGPRAWLMKIVSNTFINDYHSRASKPDRFQIDAIPEYRDSRDNPPRATLDRELTSSYDLREDVGAHAFSDEVAAALDRLRPERREAIIRHLVLDQDYEEIAEAIGTTTGTVGSRLSRARDDLEKILRTYAVREYALGHVRAKKPHVETGPRRRRSQPSGDGPVEERAVAGEVFLTAGPPDHDDLRGVDAYDRRVTGCPATHE